MFGVSMWSPHVKRLIVLLIPELKHLYFSDPVYTRY